jgi:hypothetical protein
MRAHIYYEVLDVLTDNGSRPSRCTAWYQDERGKKGPVASGTTKEQTLEALYQNLEQRGYKLLELPKPEPVRYFGHLSPPQS